MTEVRTAPATTRGTLLGGKVRYDQFVAGHRSGIEPVFLAAAVPARAGDRVLEAGTGAGAALLCLAQRVSGIIGVGIERDPALAGLAAANFAANDRPGLHAVAGAIEDHSAETPFDHAMANPPWHDPEGTPSPDEGRERARRACPGLARIWIDALAAGLRPRGTLTLIVAAAAVPDCIAALSGAGCGGYGLLPLWRRAGEPARLVIIRAIAGGRAPFELLAGIALHGQDGKYTAHAEAVLRAGDAVTACVPRSRS